MTTFNNKWYVVTKVYSEALPSQVFQVVATSNQEFGFRPDHKGSTSENMVARDSYQDYAIGGTQSHKKHRMFHNTPHKLICCNLQCELCTVTCMGSNKGVY